MSKWYVFWDWFDNLPAENIVFYVTGFACIALILRLIYKTIFHFAERDIFGKLDDIKNVVDSPLNAETKIKIIDDILFDLKFGRWV